MVRYTLALAGRPADEASEMAMSEEIVDIFHFGQLEETFLCDINPKGQVRLCLAPFSQYRMACH